MYGVLITGATPGGMFDTTLLEFLANVVVAFVPVAVVCDNDRDVDDTLTVLVVAAALLLATDGVLSYDSFTSL